jgi:hypothetical protein
MRLGNADQSNLVVWNSQESHISTQWESVLKECEVVFKDCLTSIAAVPEVCIFISIHHLPLIVCFSFEDAEVFTSVFVITPFFCCFLFLTLSSFARLLSLIVCFGCWFVVAVSAIHKDK